MTLLKAFAAPGEHEEGTHAFELSRVIIHSIFSATKLNLIYGAGGRN